MSKGKATGKGKTDLDQVTIRSWPKVVFLYPVMLTSLICALVQSMDKSWTDSAMAESLGMIFFFVLCLNLLVISFDFSRFKTLAIVFFILALIFFLLYLGRRLEIEIFAFLSDLLAGFHLRSSTSFYLAFGVYFAVVLVIVFFNTRFNYWVIRSNEILHKEGFLGDVKRFPSPNLKMTKEISDVFEFLLLGSGRVVLYPASEKHAFVLDHVLGVNRAEKAIQELLSTLEVEIQAHEHEPAEAEEETGAGG